jgi:hypothetical protein
MSRRREKHDLELWFNKMKVSSRAVGPAPMDVYMNGHGYEDYYTGSDCSSWLKQLPTTVWEVWITDSDLSRAYFRFARDFSCMLINNETGEYRAGPRDTRLDECIVWGEAAQAGETVILENGGDPNDGQGA